MIEARRIHCGQYKRYGDFFRVWEVETDLPEEEAVNWCFENLYHGWALPREAKWRNDVRFDGEHGRDPGYYFRGYYNVREIDGGFKFTICEPFAD